MSLHEYSKSKVRNTKKSVGIIIFDSKINKILMIQKKCTYAFSDFVIGKYDKNNKGALIERFNKMTVTEKVLINSLEFEWMWYHLFTSKDKTENYCRAFGRFYKIFLNNNKLLKSLLSQSYKSASLLWEPPKGRKNKNENSLKCAMREVFEETKIKNGRYHIIPNKK